MKPYERDFVNLNNEVLRLLLEGELFTFVLVPGVEATSNKVEREVRSPARAAMRSHQQDRRRRTSPRRDRERTGIATCNLTTFTLTSVLEEVGRWLKEGMSLFSRQRQATMARVSAAYANMS